MEENDFVSIWLEESGNPAIEELTKINREIAAQTAKILSENEMVATDFAMVVDVNPNEIEHWLKAKHSFSVKKLKEMTTAWANRLSVLEMP